MRRSLNLASLVLLSLTSPLTFSFSMSSPKSPPSDPSQSSGDPVDSSVVDSSVPLSLPSSESSVVGGSRVGGSVPSLSVGGPSLSLDELGPIIVNKDGTTSRVTNWLTMNKDEQERTQRMIIKRNEKRLKVLKEKMENGELDGEL